MPWAFKLCLAKVAGPSLLYMTVGLRVHGKSMLPKAVTRMGLLATFDSPTLRILGVTIASDLSVSVHVDALLNAGARSIYALRLLRAHRLPDHALKIVARATTINRIQYSGPALVGLCQRRRQGTTPTISRADVQIGIPDRARH